MNRWKISLVLLCVPGVTSVAQAQASASQATQNIVTVSFNAAVLQTAEARKSLSALEARYAPKQKQLQALNDVVESLRKQLADTSSNLSDAERATRAQSLESKEKELQREAEDFKSDSQSESEQIFQRVATEGLRFSADLLAAAWLYSGDRARIRCLSGCVVRSGQHGHYGRAHQGLQRPGRRRLASTGKRSSPWRLAEIIEAFAR